MFTTCKPTPEQEYALEVARVGFMAACPFYAHYFYTEVKEILTKDVDTAATDGRHLFINPEYFMERKPAERVFILAHEIDHIISRHPQRFNQYIKEGTVRGGKPADKQQLNFAADYVINAGLIEQGVGMMNNSWLYDPSVSPDELAEDVYDRIYKDKPPSSGNTFGSSGKGARGAKGDGRADGQGGAFDDVLPPSVDPVTGKEDLPTESEFKEAVARAAAAAKAIGKMPGSLQRRIDEILEPQVDWREHIRCLMTGHLGASRETWNTLNRRYAALGSMSSRPMPQFPGRKGFGAETVAVAVDTSGSIGEKELATFFAEVGGIIASVKPKRVILIWCDAQINRVDEARSLDELADIRCQGGVGGGGTSFIPPFNYLAKEGITPETLVYLTDLYGPFPEKPAYPVVWAATTEQGVPWGDVVRIKVQ